ncbi:MAG TPA: PDZ domain-containing protein [Lacipirellulaceae bacterium]|jgi:hypothetical protein|nr:PDZ domain-containing protein [Lacipirellulaceae bacterium]
MITNICRMSALSIVASFGFTLNDQAQLMAQESSRGRFRAEATESLPPPERPETARPETARPETARPETSASGPALVNPNRARANPRRPYLGITFDPEYTDAAVARSVVPGGPADQAGIQPGDTIDAINDQTVSSYRDAYAIVQALRPGEIVDIDFSRRVSGRTQAVLGGGTTQAADAANDSEQDIDRAYPERPASFPMDDLPERERPIQERSLREDPVEERLPEPTHYREFPRSNRAQLSAAPSDPRLNFNGATADRRDSSERQDRVERRRPTERGLLGRPLLRWRRN